MVSRKRQGRKNIRFVNEELKNEEGEGRRSIAKENALNSLIVRTNHSDSSLFALFVHIYARCI